MSLIKKPHELVAKTTVRACIYGPPGIGKSTLSLSSPRPLHIDIDDGVDRVDARHQKDTIPAKKWEDVLAVLTEDLTDYDTLVPDTVGKMLVMINEYLGRINPNYKQKDGTLTQKGYAARKQVFIDFLKRVTDLGKHLVFVVHDIEKPKGEITQVRPDVGGSSSGDLLKDLDLVGYMESIGSVRVISFEPTEAHYGKNSIGLPPIIQLPDLNNAPNNLLTQIFEQAKQRQLGKHEMGVTYQKLKADIQSRVDAIKKPEDANSVYKWLNEFDGHIWNSLYEGKMLVVNKAKELGFTANPVTRQFEAAPPPPKPPKPDPNSKVKAGEKAAENGPANANVGGDGKQGVDGITDPEELKRIEENKKLA